MSQESSSKSNRRSFIKGVGGAAAGVALVGASQNLKAASTKKMNTKHPLSTNVYPWMTFYRREEKEFEADLSHAVAEVKRSGADHYEPNLKSLEFVDTLATELQKQDVGMQSVYVNSDLWDKEKAKESIDWVMAIVRKAKKRMGTNVVVTNPSPIQWGSPENKNDEQLEIQRDALEELGKGIHSEGLHLAYHFHDPEFREGAREVHHMLAATDSKYVKLCLDSHWAFRGAGDSNVALFDIIRLYGDRIVELHIRQSKDGVWTEAFGEGDIDHERLTNELIKIGVSPVVTMEQAVEANTPKTMDALEAHKISHARARKVFAPFIA